MKSKRILYYFVTRVFILSCSIILLSSSCNNAQAQLYGGPQLCLAIRIPLAAGIGVITGFIYATIQQKTGEESDYMFTGAAIAAPLELIHCAIDGEFASKTNKRNTEFTASKNNSTYKINRNANQDIAVQSKYIKIDLIRIRF